MIIFEDIGGFIETGMEVIMIIAAGILIVGLSPLWLPVAGIGWLARRYGYKD